MRDQELDNLFKKRLDNRQFEFNEAYWESALELILTDEQQQPAVMDDDRSPPSYLLFGFLLFLLVSMGGMSLYYSLTSPKLPSPYATVQPSNEIPAYTTESTSIEKTKTTSLIEVESGESTLVDLGTRGGSTDIKPSNRTETNAPKKEDNNPSTVPGFEATIPLFNTTKEVADGTQQQSVKEKTRETSVLEAISQPITAPAAMDKIGMNLLDGVDKSEESEGAEQIKLTPSPKEAVLPKEEQKPKAPRVLPAIDSVLLQLDEPILIGQVAPESLLELPGHTGGKLPRNHFGISAGVNIIQTNSMAANQESTKPTHIMPVAGIRYGYQLHPYISLNTGANYYSREGFDMSMSYTSVVFDFGFVETQTDIHINRLHYVEIPLYMGVHFGRHTVLAGGDYAHLLNARATVNETVTTSLSPPVSTTRQAGGYTQGFMGGDVGILLGYELALTPALGVGVRAHYGLRDLTHNDFYNDPRKNQNLFVRLSVNYDLTRF